MQDTPYKLLLNAQHQFFATGTTRSVDFRIQQLKKLKEMIHAHQTLIVNALKKDLNKSEMEAVVSEVILVTDELDYIIKHLKKWSKPEKVPSPFPLCWPGRSVIQHEPYGSVLIIGPWNYPFMLVMSPLIGAMCAGNCAIIKPSEIATHTQDVIINMINDHFPREYVAAIKAGPQEVQQLINEKLDYIFFTGGTQIGKIIMEAAAKHLTPVTLELGGKSPCIVDETANLDYAARRIIWGKLMNAGQVCLAPDYLLVHRSRKEALIEKLKAVIKKFYGENPANSSSYCRIIDKKHFDRLSRLISNGNLLYGGKTSEPDLYISPTLIDGVSWTDPVMQEEIFGPILPILTYEHLDEVIAAVNARSKPLALYLFTRNKANEKTIMSNISFGGGCVNDSLLQIANYHLPFGGIGQSGIGAYHGKYSFETFSHRKSIFKKTLPIDLDLAYPPYSKRKLTWLSRLMKLRW